MKKLFSLIALCMLMGLFACAAAQQTPSYAPDTTAQKQAALYFRFYHTDYLAREERTVLYTPAVAFEKALAQALVEGPSSVYPHLKPLFPEGTKVLSAQGQGSILFVTFNENLMHPYPDEADPYQSGYREGEGLTRRELAMAALSLTIAENTDYAYVQPLIMGKVSAGTSLRLSNRYYLREDDTLPSPLTWAQDRILTPGAAARLLLNAWQEQNSGDMQLYMTGESIASSLKSLPVLSSFTLSEGTVSMNGQSALVPVTLSVKTHNDSAYNVVLWPLRLNMVQGAWLTDTASFQKMLEDMP